jgi:hypothetical protein
MDLGAGVEWSVYAPGSPRGSELVPVNRDCDLIARGANDISEHAELKRHGAFQKYRPVHVQLNRITGIEMMVSGKEHPDATDVHGMP